jgi:hypothetical protein
MRSDPETTIWVEGISPPLQQIEEDYADSQTVQGQDVLALCREVRRLRNCLDQLASCANILCTAIREEDGIALHYGVEGTEFEVMRAAWLLGEQEEAKRIHGLVGDHSPKACPVCSGLEAFAK